MTLSLIVVTLAFTGLVLWVYWPSHREAIEKKGQLIFEPGEQAPGTRHQAGSTGSGS